MEFDIDPKQQKSIWNPFSCWWLQQFYTREEAAEFLTVYKFLQVEYSMWKLILEFLMIKNKKYFFNYKMSNKYHNCVHYIWDVASEFLTEYGLFQVEYAMWNSILKFLMTNSLERLLYIFQNWFTNLKKLLAIQFFLLPWFDDRTMRLPM